MLPFLSKRQQTGLTTVIERKPDEAKPEDTGIEAAAKDLIEAVHMKDTKLVVAALRAAIELIESEPSEEAPESIE